MSLTMTDEERDAWLAWRRAGIGGSDIAPIMGLSRWASPATVYCDKLGISDPVEMTEAMWWGHQLEDDIAARFEYETGLAVLSHQEQVEHAEHPWRRCTLDGRVFDPAFGGGELGIFEAKSTRDSIDDWGGVVPMEYQCQATWNMVVTGTTRCYMGVLHAAFGLQLKVYELHLDATDVDEVVDAATQFWFGHVQRRVPPPADGHEETARAFATIWPSGPGVRAEIEADDEWRRLVQVAIDAKARQDAAAAEARLALNNLRAAIGDCTDVVVTDPDTGKTKPIVTWRADKNGTRTLRTPGEK